MGGWSCYTYPQVLPPDVPTFYFRFSLRYECSEEVQWNQRGAVKFGGYWRLLRLDIAPRSAGDTVLFERPLSDTDFSSPSSTIDHDGGVWAWKKHCRWSTGPIAPGYRYVSAFSEVSRSEPKNVYSSGRVNNIQFLETKTNELVWTSPTNTAAVGKFAPKASTSIGGRGVSSSWACLLIALVMAWKWLKLNERENINSCEWSAFEWFWG